MVRLLDTPQVLNYHQRTSLGHDIRILHQKMEKYLN